MEEKNKSLSQDFFLYLFSTIALWIVATNFGTIIFQIINIYIPDVAMPEPPPYSRNLIRWSIASLIVVFPIYVLVMRFLNRDVRTFAEKAELKIRKWLLNLTLFLAAIVIISDLISLIYNFLQGELTLRFSLKIITIFVISAGIFSYYRKILKSENLQQPSFTLAIFPKIVIGLVTVSIIAGFVATGLPKGQRLERLDESRISALSFIEQRIYDYWKVNKKLPDSLDDLKSLNLNIVIPVDPQTKTNYGYEIVDRDNLKYKICANFETSDNESSHRTIPPPYYQSLWLHDAEYTCFERVVTP